MTGLSFLSKKPFIHEVIYFFSFWLLNIGLIFLTFLTIIKIEKSVTHTLGFILPIIPPVTLIYIVFEKFFIKRKFIVFSILTVVILALFSIFNFYLIKYLIGNPEGESNTFLSIILFFGIYVGIKYLYKGVKQQFALEKLKNQQLESEITIEKIKTKQVETELKYLKAQINPHFLFNTLNSIYSLIIENSNHAADSVLMLSSLVRYILDSSKSKFVSLKKEIQFIENYINLERIRLEDNCIINFSADIDNDKNVSPLIFISFVENCFKHGVSTNIDKNIINIFIRSDDKQIEFNCDNYISIHKINKNNKTEQTGIDNIKKRLNLFYKNKFDLKIIESNEKYIVKLVIKN